MLFVALCALLLSSTQVVLPSWALEVTFTEAPQCEPFSFALQGDTPQGTGRPTSLSIIPFGLTPLVIPIQGVPNGTFGTTLPYSAGTRFVALLEDGRGQPIQNVSGIMRVGEPQQKSASDCFDANPPVHHFSFQDQPVQCENFQISYNTTTVPQAPQVRVYSPEGHSYFLNMTSKDEITGNARFTMSVSAGRKVILLMDGGNGIRETTEIFTVAGDSSSSTDCLGKERELEAIPVVATPQKPGISSRSIIIGSAAGGAAVVLIAIAMGIYVLLERRRKRVNDYSFDARRMQRDPEMMDEKRASPLPTFLFSGDARGNSRGNSPEPPRKLTRSPKRGMRTDSLASWVQVTPEDQKVPASQRLAPPSPARHQSLAPSLAVSESRNVEPQSLNDRDRLSINSLDIEGMLNMATMQSEAARKGSTPSFHLSPSPPRVITNLTVPRRALKVNSDIPDDLLSAYSRDSVNPFTTPVYGESPFADARVVSDIPVAPSSSVQVPGRVPVGRRGSPTGDSAASSWYGFGEAR